MKPYKLPRISGTIPEQLVGIKTALTQLVNQLNTSDDSENASVIYSKGEDLTRYTKKEVDNLLKEFKKDVADYATEIGTSGGWAYRVYKSGYVMMRGRFSITLNAGETAKSTYVSLPFNMTTCYPFAQTVQQAWRLTAPVDVGVEGNQIKVSYYTASQTAAVTYYFNLLVVGQKA